jgi:hypothetical protein
VDLGFTGRNSLAWDHRGLRAVGQAVRGLDHQEALGVQFEKINHKIARDWMIHLKDLGRAKATGRVRAIVLRK